MPKNLRDPKKAVENDIPSDTIYKSTIKPLIDATYKPYPTLRSTLTSNGFLSRDFDRYQSFNRYGWINPYDHDKYREYLFFTKPDLNIFNNKSIGSADLVSDASNTMEPKSTLANGNLNSSPILKEACNNHKFALAQLEYEVKDTTGINYPFMCLLSNSCTSKLDLSPISSESQSGTSNIMGTEITYRGHSLKSDNGYDFSLSFTDTQYLDIYYMVKSYDEIMRLYKTGEHRPKEKYIVNNVLDYMFSIYKFIVGSDGETIVYFAKLTGVYFTDVPRSDMSDPGDDGIKYSLSFHANFIEDSNPVILSDFNSLIPINSALKENNNNFLPVFNPDLGTVDNTWARIPYIIKASNSDPIYGKRVARRNNRSYDYYLKWIKNT